jgi:PAS domain S-box-containing protein
MIGLPGNIHPDDSSEMIAAWVEMLAGSRSAEGEVRLRRADGTYRWHLWRAHPERDTTGQVVRWVGTCTDIHDQKRAEEQLELRIAQGMAELRTSEAHFRQAFDFAGIGMAIVALDGRFLRLNKSFCEIVGYSQPDLLQKTFQDITHPEDLAADLAHVQDLIVGRRRAFQMEKRYFHRAGHVVWVRLTVSIVRDAFNRPLHFVSQVEDITERKALSESLAKARDQALEASRMKSEFLATMSHEIRTPMNGVIGMTALLRDTPLSPVQSEYVRTIESSGDALLTIINDILDYSKIEAGRIDLELAPFNLRQCVEDTLDVFAARAEEKRLELLCDIGADVPGQVTGDSARLRQILVNLLGNALKFTERGEIAVVVRTENAGARQRLRFAVRDTGMGIPPEGMERLFKSFSQVDASTTRRFGGTGLGLAISKRLVEMMGGSIGAQSELGEGSTFHFTVLVDVDPDADARPDLTHHLLEGRRVLVVKNNATTRRVISELVQSWGMVVDGVASAEEALTLLRARTRFDIAIVDQQLVGLDGEELARSIHALPQSATLPIILLTSLTRHISEEPFLQSLAKPVKAGALRSALRAAFRGHAVAVRSREPFPPPTIDTTLGARCPMRILIAEDNVVNQRIASLLLERLGYRPATVVNGMEAVLAVQGSQYDAILMDVEMPELDGCEATRRIRAYTGSTTRPWIIALTAGVTPADRERAMNSGMNDFLTKPVRTDLLTASLERAHAGLNGALAAVE